MNRRFLWAAIGLGVVVAFLAGFSVAASLRAPAGAAPASTAGAGPSARRATGGPPNLGVDFSDVAVRVNPAVVNIDATSRGRRVNLPPGHPKIDPFDDTGADPSPPGRRDAPERGSGSGFIISADGYILTNNHVIERADRITVKLADDRTLPARTVGTDPDTDIALLKVDAGAPLPAVTLGDSSRLRVGEWVCAIGNPLGYEHTLTAGVVSFMGRKLFDASLDNFIQTDAAIDYGNSGGPLLNARGEVVGINTAISSDSASIGFAVPINIAAASIAQLKSSGRVVRGYMGVALRDVDRDLQESLGLPAAAGALVEDVVDGSPASRAGVTFYDLVEAADGRPVKGADELIARVSALAPGTLVRLRIRRGVAASEVSLRLTERPPAEEPPGQAGPGKSSAAPAGPQGVEALGLAVADVDRESARRFKLPRTLRGAVITRVEPFSPAYDADLERGFVVLEINRQPTASAAEFRRLTMAAKPGQVLALFVFLPGGEHALRTLRVEGSR
jgi:serine protease Do